jgi:hypothetical protein
MRKRDEKCRYFTGLMNTVCDADVDYSTVKKMPQVPYTGGSILLPCFNDAGTSCQQQSLYTAEEKAEQEARHKAVLDEFVRKVESGLCVECGIKYTPKQVGRCVYADECGHRQFQGKADPKMSDDEYEEQSFAWMDEVEPL